MKEEEGKEKNLDLFIEALRKVFLDTQEETVKRITTDTFKAVVRDYFTSIADFLHECKVRGLSLEQTATDFDDYVKRTLQKIKEL